MANNKHLTARENKILTDCMANLAFDKGLLSGEFPSEFNTRCVFTVDLFGTAITNAKAIVSLLQGALDRHEKENSE